MAALHEDGAKAAAEHSTRQPDAAPLPESARLPLVLLVAILTALLFHGCFWLLWTYTRGLV